MSEQANRPLWMEDELVQNIPREKLNLLSQIFSEATSRRQTAGNLKSKKEMLALLMPVLQQARESGLSFTPQEMQSVIAAIRKYSTPEELAQIDKIL